jgi:hypothetical protein
VHQLGHPQQQFLQLEGFAQVVITGFQPPDTVRRCVRAVRKSTGVALPSNRMVSTTVKPSIPGKHHIHHHRIEVRARVTVRKASGPFTTVVTS